MEPPLPGTWLCKSPCADQCLQIDVCVAIYLVRLDAPLERATRCSLLRCLQGERETNELNNKLAQFSENAMKFTMDGGLSAYDYKAEEDAAEADVNFKRLAGVILSTPAAQRPLAICETMQYRCAPTRSVKWQLQTTLSQNQVKQLLKRLMHCCPAQTCQL